MLLLSTLPFFGAIACGGGGGDSSPDPTQPTGKDSVSAVVGSSGGQVTTPSGQAGVQVPPGALGQNVTITVTRLPTPSAPNSGPLQTNLNQYGPYYEIQTSPANATLGDSVRVGVCQVTDPSSPYYPPEAIHDRLRLAHTVGSTTQILERVNVNDFLRCTNVTADAAPDPHASRLARVVSSLRRTASGFFSPQFLYAAHGGLGGKVKSFSPFGAVDPLTGLVIGPEFNISATADNDDFGGIAFDGTNYLVITETRKANGTSTVQGQLVSPSGTLVGGSIAIPAANNGGSGRVAFDGTNYLVVWSTESADPAIRGQFISKAGALVGSAIAPVPSGAANPNAIVFGGGTYFMAYSRVSGTDANGQPLSTQYGKVISTAGANGAQLLLSSGFSGDGFNNAAFDGTNFLTVYRQGSAVNGRFVSPAGVVGAEKVLATGRVEELVTLGFNGTNYLVTMASGQPPTNAVALLVNTAGTPVGPPITLAAAAGIDKLPTSVAISGTDFLVSFIDSMAVGKATTKAVFVSSAGALRGPAFTLASPVAGKAGVGVVAGFVGTKYFALLLRGIQSTTTPEDTDSWTQVDVVGQTGTAFIPPP